MSKIQNPDHFLSDSSTSTMIIDHCRDDIIELLRNYGEHVKDKVLDIVIENGKAKLGDLGVDGHNDPMIDKDSILDLKMNKDLEI